MVREFLLGDNPFIGVSHLAQEKARKELKEATLANKIRVIEAAIEGGATGFTFSTHPANLKLLMYLREHRTDLLEQIDYYPLVPYAQTYVKKANIRGTPGLVKSILMSTFKHSSKMLDLIIGIATFNLERCITLFVEMDLLPYLKVLPRKRIKAILLHPILTESIIAFNLSSLVKFFNEIARKRLNIEFGLATVNIGHLYKWLHNIDYHPEYIMTPVNPIGYQMAPNKEAAEKAIVELSSRSKIIAISILASGVVRLSNAIEYLTNFKEKIYAVSSASIKPERIRKNFEMLIQDLFL